MEVRGIVFKEQPFTQAAATDDQFRAACRIEQGLDDGGAGDDEVGPFARQAGDLLAVGAGPRRNFRIQGVEVLCRQDVVMHLRQLVIRCPLIHLGKSTGRAANADEGEAQIFNPVGSEELFPYEFQAVLQGDCVYVALEIEFFRNRYGADGDGNGMNWFAFLHQGQLDAGAAQVEQEKVLHGDGVDDAQIAEIGFPFACNDSHGYARFRVNPLQELVAVRGVAHGGGGDGDAVLDFHNLHDVLIYL